MIKYIDSYKYAAFIMAYHRPDSIVRVIDNLIGQSVAPEHIIVIDNSTDLSVKKVVENYNLQHLEYISMGYNSGPAGAARAAVRILKDRGYNWVMVSGDDTKHPSKYVAETILNMINRAEGRIGVAAGVGHRFNWLKGRGEVIPTQMCEGYLDVDYVAGGACMMINTEVAGEVDFHDSDLFFGWEELDFCLRVKKHGYRIVVDGPTMLKYRELWGTDSGSSSRAYALRKSDGQLVRQYYSVRNIIYIMTRKHRLYNASIRVGIKAALKSAYSFKWGLNYGLKSSRYLMAGVVHAVIGKMGHRYDL